MLKSQRQPPLHGPGDARARQHKRDTMDAYPHVRPTSSSRAHGCYSWAERLWSVRPNPGGLLPSVIQDPRFMRSHNMWWLVSQVRAGLKQPSPPHADWSMQDAGCELLRLFENSQRIPTPRIMGQQTGLICPICWFFVTKISRSRSSPGDILSPQSRSCSRERDDRSRMPACD